MRGQAQVICPANEVTGSRSFRILEVRGVNSTRGWNKVISSHLLLKRDFFSCFRHLSRVRGKARMEGPFFIKKNQCHAHEGKEEIKRHPVYVLHRAEKKYEARGCGGKSKRKEEVWCENG